jgi:predicted protein tyrosine phosphatase
MIFVTNCKNVLKDIKIFKPSALISITDPGINNPKHELDIPTLNLSFQDVCFEPQSDVDKLRYKPPTKLIVEDIFHFGAFSYKKNTLLMTHCMAGISRSSAAAIIALCPHYGYEDAVNIVADFDVYQSEGLYEKGSSWFIPNDLMIKYADEILCLNGSLQNLVYSRFCY